MLFIELSGYLFHNDLVVLRLTLIQADFAYLLYHFKNFLPD